MATHEAVVMERSATWLLYKPLSIGLVLLALFSLSALQTCLPSLSCCAVNSAQLGWCRQRPPTALSHLIPQSAAGSTHLPAHINMCMHCHTWQKVLWKSQTYLLIFTKSTPPPFGFICPLLSVLGLENVRGVTRVRLLFQHKLNEKEGGWEEELKQNKGPHLTQHPSPLLWYFWKSFFSLYSAFSPFSFPLKPK